MPALTALRVCDQAGRRDPTSLGVCLDEQVADMAEREALLWGAGVAWGLPLRTAAERAAVAEAIGPGGEAFAAGARSPAAGSAFPYRLPPRH